MEFGKQKQVNKLLTIYTFKCKEKLKQTKEDYENFKNEGCVDEKSEPSLRFISNNKKFKASVETKKQEILAKLPILNDIKNTIKQIDD